MAINETKFSQTDFSGGLSKHARIGENELQECTNLDLREMGSFKPALADTLIATVSSVVCHQVIDGKIYYLVGTTLYEMNTDGTGNVSIGTIGSSYFVAKNWRGVHIIISTNAVYVVINSTLYSLGTTAPAAAPTLGAAAGPLTGTYYVSYTYVSRYTLPDGSTYEEESVLSPEATFAPAAQGIAVSNMTASAEAGVNYKRIYIRGGALTYRYRAGEVANATTTFTIDQTEAQLVLLSIEDCDTNETPPTSPTWGDVVNGRLFLTKGDTLYWSRALIMGAFPADNNTVLPRALKGIYESGANLAILMADGEVIYMNPGYTTSAGGYLHYPKDPQGCISIRSAAHGYYASDEGVAFFGGAEPSIITDRIWSELGALTGRTATIGAYLRGRYYFCIPAHSIMYEYDANRNRFQKYDGIIGVAAGDDGTLYVAKTDGIYSFGTAMTRKAFAYRSPEVFLPEDTAFDRIAIEADFGSDAATVALYRNNVEITSVTKVTSGRQMVYVPITQDGGSAFSVRISRASAVTHSTFAVYGVHLR